MHEFGFMLQVRIGLGVLHFMASIIWAIVSVFGMNLGKDPNSGFYKWAPGDTHPQFLEVITL